MLKHASLALILFAAGCISKSEYRAFVRAAETHNYAVAKPHVAHVNSELAAVISPSASQLLINGNLNAAQQDFEAALMAAKVRANQ